jgi:hypothetical protein
MHPIEYCEVAKEGYVEREKANRGMSSAYEAIHTHCHVLGRGRKEVGRNGSVTLPEKQRKRN